MSRVTRTTLLPVALMATTHPAHVRSMLSFSQIVKLKMEVVTGILKSIIFLHKPVAERMIADKMSAFTAVEKRLLKIIIEN